MNIVEPYRGPGRPKGSPPCDVEGCDKSSQKYKKCSTHWQQLPEVVAYQKERKQKLIIERRQNQNGNCIVCLNHIDINKRVGSTTCSAKCKNDLHSYRNTASKRSVPIEEILFFVREMPSCSLCLATTNLKFDHNHETGELRSRLCARCNVLVGFLEKTEKEVLNKALLYINFT